VLLQALVGLVSFWLCSARFRSGSALLGFVLALLGSVSFWLCSARFRSGSARLGFVLALLGSVSFWLYSARPGLCRLGFNAAALLGFWLALCPVVF